MYLVLARVVPQGGEAGAAAVVRAPPKLSGTRGASPRVPLQTVVSDALRQRDPEHQTSTLCKQRQN